MQVSELQQLAHRIYSGEEPQLKPSYEARARELICRCQNLPVVLETMRCGTYPLLLVGSVLLEAMQKGSYLPQLNVMVEELATSKPDRAVILQKEIDTLKHGTYWIILQQCLLLLGQSTLQNYLRNTLVEMAAACLRQLFHQRGDIAYLQRFVMLAFPGMPLSPQFEQQHPKEKVVIGPTAVSHPQQLLTSLSIMVELMDNQLMPHTYKNWYEMRRMVTVFRVGFLAVVIEIAIYHFKLLLMWLDENVSGRFEGAAQEVMLSLKLFSLCLNYPIVLTLNQFDNELEAADNGTSQILYPDYFRNITGDTELLSKMSLLHEAVISNKLPASKHSQEIVKLVVLNMSRLAGASFYMFEGDQDRRIFRSACIGYLVGFLRSYNFPDEYYTNSLISFCGRVLINYNVMAFQQSFRQLSESALMFALKVVQNYPLQIERIDTNVISRTFELLKRLEGNTPSFFYIDAEEESGSDLRTDMYLPYFQQILEQYLMRLSDLPTLVHIFKEKQFRTYQKEIECFNEMFGPICFVFDKQFQHNIEKLNTTPVDTLPIEAQQVIMHFCTRMLFQQGRSITIPCGVVRRFYQTIMQKNVLQVSDMTFLSEFLGHILLEVEEGQSITGLWMRLRDTDNTFQPFSQVISSCIQKCLGNFVHASESIIDCSLSLLKKIYSQLQRHSLSSKDPHFKQYSQTLFLFLNKLQSTVFAKPLFFKKRIVLFQMISLIWLETGEPSTAYMFYKAIEEIFKNQSHPNSVLKYLYDCTGLVGEICDPEMYRVVFDLIVGHLPFLVGKCLEAPNTLDAEIYRTIRKAMLRLFEALLKDTNSRISRGAFTTTPIPTQVDFLWPILQQFSRYPYGKRLLVVWRSLAEVNKLRRLPALPPIANLTKPKHSDTYKQLVTCYLNSMLRVSNLDELYPHIHEHLQTMYEWWETIIERQIDPNIEDFSAFIEARLWRTENQQRITAKILYMAGNYRPKFRVLPELFEGDPSQQAFVRRFVAHTQTVIV